MNGENVRIGSVLANHYLATNRIASGAMGEVWEGVHIAHGTRVALKMMRKEALASSEMRARFSREAFLLGRVRSEHVVRLIDYATEGRHGPTLVMELLEGPTLADLLRREPLSIDAAVDIAIDVLRGLDAMHARQVIHRDVKPANIVLRQTVGARRCAVLVDLGVGRLDQAVCDDGTYEVAFDTEELTTNDRLLGTFEYMAPEQILSCHTADASADVYAVGAVLYRAVAGAHPFGDKHGDELLRLKVSQPVPRLETGRHHDTAKKFERIIHRALALAPDERFKTACELLLSLESLQMEMRGTRCVPTPSNTCTFHKSDIAQVCEEVAHPKRVVV